MMKIKQLFFAGSFLLAASIISFSSESEKPFKALFNYENLDGWVIEHGDASTFVVEKGTIKSTEKTGYPAWLRTERTYENYDLLFEFLMEGGAAVVCCLMPRCMEDSRGLDLSIRYITTGKII